MGFGGILAQLAQGAVYTIVVTLACSAMTLASGLAVASLRRLQLPGITLLLDLYTYVYRSVPVLVMLFIVPPMAVVSQGAPGRTPHRHA